MLTLESSDRFTRDEAAQVLLMAGSAVDLLVQQKVLPESPTAGDLEAYFRDGLLRLYKSVAVRRATAPAPHIEIAADTGVTLSGDEELVVGKEPDPPVVANQLAATDAEVELAQQFEDFHASFNRPKQELRKAPRYEPQRKLKGMYREVEFTLLEASATGLRIRHDESLRAGDEATVRFTVSGRSPRTYSLRARVAWTTIAQRDSGPSFCLSGLQVTANIDHLQAALEQLRSEDGGRTRTVMPQRTPPALVGVTDDDVAAIIRAHRRLSADPVEAARWYNRVRFSLSDPAVKKAAPLRARDRDEVLGIWEYLQRKVAIDTVTNVIAWLRQTRSAAAV